ncbi:TlpA family protein disulfide reductase [Winogradskyella psychrotolerans]|uniref:TlpA family protein disulfide reductase n=1 Tax=Winogradskyella psychrotolerans TaxID=1344585 RepID=UPI001C06E69A|nr:TlpA disulfide reductase family protein [Winogradskyella psychrotolerans]MBU2921939.1 TlpA family protein disulfide reductase [Winogradskyella psychrotolerans]
MSYSNIILIILISLLNTKPNPNIETTINFSEYTFNTTRGNQTSLTLEDNKIYILDFWYLECPPCVKDHGVIAEYLKTTKHKNIEIIGISIDRSKSKWITYLDTHQYNWTNYNEDRSGKILYKDLDIEFFPTYLVVNSKGKILQKSNRFQKALNFIESANLQTQ